MARHSNGRFCYFFFVNVYQVIQHGRAVFPRSNNNVSNKAVSTYAICDITSRKLNNVILPCVTQLFTDPFFCNRKDFICIRNGFQLIVVRFRRILHQCRCRLRSSKFVIRRFVDLDFLTVNINEIIKPFRNNSLKRPRHAFSIRSIKYIISYIDKCVSVCILFQRKRNLPALTFRRLRRRCSPR